MSESASHHASATSGIPQPHGGLGIFRLVTTVITLIVGGGVFTLAGDQAAGGASGAAILTAWSISGIGVLCLVMTFFALSRIKPQLKGGIYSYGNAGFGDFWGFNSAWGYWISALLCTVSFSALLFGALSYFFPIFGGGTNLPSVIGASLLIWFYVFLVSRGIKEATGVNAVITISKFVPIFVAITAIIFLQKFDLGIFLANMSQGADPGLPFFDQVSNTMMITIWVFVGIEGAVAISGRAKKERDVGKATIIAFICVLSIYLMVSVLSMGVMPLSELAQLENPALAGVMEHAVGQWGAILINGGVVLSLVGAMLGYTVLSAESPFEAAQEGVFTKSFAKINKKAAPIVTLILTNIIIEVFLVIMLFSDSTYQFFSRLSAGMILLPYTAVRCTVTVAMPSSSTTLTGFCKPVRPSRPRTFWLPPVVTSATPSISRAASLAILARTSVDICKLPPMVFCTSMLCTLPLHAVCKTAVAAYNCRHFR